MDTKRKLLAGLVMVVFAVAACDDGSSPTSPPAPLPETLAPADAAASPAAVDAASPAPDAVESPAA